MSTLIADAEALLPAVVDIRRTLHCRPELGLHLPETQATVLGALDGLDLEIRLGQSLSSVVATLHGDHAGPTVLLRADMDALPVRELTDLDFRSEIDGVMHACGHDAHTAMLVGAARLLHSRRDQIAGRVLFMFQPGEEGHDGARRMLAEGLLDPDLAGDVTLAFAVHQLPMVPSGEIHSRGGVILASVDGFRITVRGKAGHAATPHSALDPIPVACEVVQAMQTLVTRQFDVFDPVVVTVAQVAAGFSRGVIPETAEIQGTFRAVTETAREQLRQKLTTLANGICSAHGLTAETELIVGYDRTVNDIDAAESVLHTARQLIGDDRVVVLDHPVHASEDFGYILNEVPGAFVVLGTQPPGVSPEDVAPVHSPTMVLDESALATGVALHTAVALEHLTRP